MKISLVIPAHNCESTIGACLASVAPLLEAGELLEIICVDDGSIDASARIISSYPVTLVPGSGGGAGAARNLGWRAARGEWIWFIDSDCVAERGALEKLRELVDASDVAGVGGSYGNMNPQSLVASLIHEEIVARHERMPQLVNFLSTFNVLYRRAVLEEIGGFDECRYNGPGVAGPEDTDLAFRVVEAGYRLKFTQASRVKHFHLTHYGRYLRVQQRHGFYRVRLYLDHPQRAGGDSYSGPADHLQPPLAMLSLASAPLLLWPPFGWLPLMILILLIALQLPLALRIARRTGSWKLLAYIPFGFLRAYCRGFGMTAGVINFFLARRPTTPLVPCTSKI